MQSNVKNYGNLLRMLRQLAAFTLFLFATTAYSASKTVLVLGDSLSAEYGLARGSGWVPLLEKRLKAERIDATIVNASISGETTGGGRARLPALLEQHRPDVVVIELGANDGLRGLPLSAAEANLRSMIAASRNVKAKVLLVGMQLPPNYGKEYTEKFIGLFTNIARSTGTPLVPFLLHGIADQPHMFQTDRIHPVAEAQPIMLDNIWPFLSPLLSR
jgi:acyl-CoA thioesterase I